MKYFAYGSNMNKAWMRDLCRSSVAIGRYTLPGYRLVFRGVADVVEDPNNSVLGVLWSIGDSDEFQLDGYEGYPLLYGKRYHDGILFYQMAHGFEQHAPNEHYLNRILEGMQDFDITVSEMLTSMGLDESAILKIGDPSIWQV